MKSRWTRWAALVGIAVVALVAAVFLGKAVAGSDEPSSRADYQQAVVTGRDRVDFALERIGNSQSPEELVSRIDEAAATVDASAAELDETNPPSELTARHDELVQTLRAFSDELAGTAATLEDPTFAGVFPGLNSLSFKQWVTLNAVLADLRSNGIQVRPLARH